MKMMMSQLCCHCLLVLAATLVACQARPQQQNDLFARILADKVQSTPFHLKSAVTKMSDRIYTTIAGQQAGNVVLSPFSIHTLLSMLMYGSPEESQTYDELSHLLALSSELHEEYALNFLRMLNRYDLLRGNDKVDIQVANKMYLSEVVELDEKFKQTLNIFFRTDIEELNMLDGANAVKTINEFVKNNTGNIIKDLLKQGDITPDSLLVLVNAIFFKGQWKYMFGRTNTDIGAWHVPGSRPVSRELMKAYDINAGIAYIKKLKSRILELPYRNEEFRMLVILPDDDVDVREVDEKIGAGDLDFDLLENRLFYGPVNVTLPKFKAELEVQLNSILEELDVKAIFDQGLSDLSDISVNYPNLHVSKAIHKANIEVNEEGATATAATVAILDTRSVSRPELFEVNKPFLFVIQDKVLQVPLFVGRIVDPEGRLELAPPKRSSEIEQFVAELVQNPAVIHMGDTNESGEEQPFFQQRHGEGPELEELPDCDEFTGFENVKDPDQVSFPCKNEDGQATQVTRNPQPQEEDARG